MCNTSHSRGNVILLVVGVLAALALVGSAFLMIAWANNKEAAAIGESAPMRSISEGLLARLMEQLKTDLHIGANGPFSDTGTLSGAALWSVNTDYPSEDVDAYLACTAPEEVGAAGNWVWRHVTNLDGAAAAGFRDLPVNHPSLVDTDGDGVGDAVLRRTSVYDSRGNEYYYAMRVIDTLSLINVNTANKPGGYAYTTPTSIDLKRILDAASGGTTLFSDVHMSRCGGSPPLDMQFNNDMALRLMLPAADYRPFDAADELGLRWLNGTQTSCGRLYDPFTQAPMLPAVFANTRSYLTTYGTDRLLTRHRTQVAQMEWTLKDAAETENAFMTRVYDQFCRLAPPSLFPTAVAKERAAAHFAVNLMEYMRNAATPIAFQPSGSPTTYFGLRVPPVVISEVYAKYDDNSGSPLSCYAIELRNVTSGDLNINGWKVGASTIAGAPAIPFNGYLVLYSLNGYTEADVQLQAVVPKHSMAGIDFSQGKTVCLYDTDGMPVDEAGTDDLINPPTVFEGDYSRSDDGSAGHPLVAQYAKNSNPGHTLGDLNSVVNVGLTYAVPIADPGVPLTDIGQLADIYLTGPRVDDPLNPTNAVPFSVGIKSFPDRPARGRLDHMPVGLGAAQPIETDGFSVSAAASHEYPDVPYAALLQEMFSVLRGDMTTGYQRNLYGRVNINTATPETLYAMPFDSAILKAIPSADPATNWKKIADVLLAYRDRRDTVRLETPEFNVPALVQYGTLERAVATGIADLRENGKTNRIGYLSSGETAIPLAQYYGWALVEASQNPADIGKSISGWASTDERDRLFRQVSNLLTVRSDTFAVYIRVQLGKDVDPDVKRQYVAVLDRSNVSTNNDVPMIRMFAEVK